MSIQYLFTPNNYNLNCNTVIAENVITNNFTVDNFNATNIIADNIITTDFTAENVIATNITADNVNIANDVTLENITVNNLAWTNRLKVTADADINELQINGTAKINFYDHVVDFPVPITLGDSCALVISVNSAALKNYLPVEVERIGHMLIVSWLYWDFTVTIPGFYFGLGGLPVNLIPVNNPMFYLIGNNLRNSVYTNELFHLEIEPTGYWWLTRQDQTDFLMDDVVRIWTQTILMTSP